MCIISDNDILFFGFITNDFFKNSVSSSGPSPKLLYAFNDSIIFFKISKSLKPPQEN